MPRPPFKYIVHPGTVNNDKDFVSFEELCELYGVDPAAAVEYTDGYAETEYDIDLYPREDGVYEKIT